MASTRADVSDQVSVGFGGLVLASKSHIPTSFVSDEYKWVAEDLNARDLRWDGSYGGYAQVRLRPRLSVGLRLVESRSLKAAGAAGRTSQMVLINLAYLIS